jgi:hypothetical protein
MYNGIPLKQFVHWYKHTWNNSRAVEIPIFYKLFKQYEGKSILEVGNVMNHYKLVRAHDVLDKYENYNGVINQDIVDFKPLEKYDVVLSISTLEHVGFDEEVKDNNKFIAAINNLKQNIVKDGGSIVFSVPIGYNSDVDQALKNGLVRFNAIWCYKKDTDNDWFSCSWEEAIHSQNAILIGEIKNG